MEFNFDYMKDVIKDPVKSETIGTFPVDEWSKKSFISEEQDSMWVENYKKNLPYIEPCKIIDESGKFVILVGASPAIKKNYKFLKAVDDNFIIVSSNTTAKFLVENGIKVDYVFAVEGGDHIEEHFDLILLI